MTIKLHNGKAKPLQFVFDLKQLLSKKSGSNSTFGDVVTIL